MNNIVQIPGIKGRNVISLQNFNCDECGVKFKHNCTLKKHLLKKHNIKTQIPKENTIKCLKCEKAFTQRKNMIRHMKMHLEEVDIQSAYACCSTTEEIRKKIHIIASGNSDIKNGWYGSADNERKCVTDNNVNENAHTSTITQTTENNQMIK
ncbi:Uncharacterized protein FWK35_00034436 [Aphis craccivora]|uniref:C2H2-type domain-containing protein n=1 Tax=Aphis craccivora TaxID=307492 RepID=A0A6G0VRI6_APHCR|nr:Uncharacterized protein FWK35_00034436 [Aphis craccivora]